MKEENVIKTAESTIIFNGGNPLPGCPDNWDEAKKIEDKLNEGKGEIEPKWQFDCGFKLDFDGPLFHISSRFYPPKSHYGKTWNGRVTVMFLNKDVAIKEFDYPTLAELTNQVEHYVKSLIHKLSKIEFNYPGEQYQRLFNAIAEAGPTPLISQMQDIIQIVHQDFPAEDKMVHTTVEILHDKIKKDR